MRVVIDTNIALDLLVFDDPAQAALTAALQAGELQWIATAAMREELARVLGYPLIAARLAASGREPAVVLSDFDARVQRIEGVPVRAVFVCRDPDDQVFIDLAAAHRALLLSKDRAVLSMRKRMAKIGVAVARTWQAQAG